MDMVEQCEIFTEKLKQNGFENHFVVLLNNDRRVEKYLLLKRVVFYGWLTRKTARIFVSSTPELMDDFIDLMILQKVDK